jgi:hypothetical protein
MTTGYSKSNCIFATFAAMVKDSITSVKKEYVVRAITVLREQGNDNPSICEIRECISGLKKSDEFSEKYLQDNKAS